MQHQHNIVFLLMKCLSVHVLNICYCTLYYMWYLNNSICIKLKLFINGKLHSNEHTNVGTFYVINLVYIYLFRLNCETNSYNTSLIALSGPHEGERKGLLHKDTINMFLVGSNSQPVGYYVDTISITRVRLHMYASTLQCTVETSEFLMSTPSDGWQHPVTQWVTSQEK